MSLIKAQGAGDASTGFYPHTIDQSARFDGGSSSVLSRTPSSTGNRKTWTWSGWVKRSVLGTSQNFYTPFSAGPYTGSSIHLGFYYSGSKIDIISFYQYTSGYQILYETNAVFRDVSAWYHFVIAVDTTDSTSTDRVKIYLNGTRITSFQTSTAPSLNLDTYMNLSGTTHYVGSSSRASTDNLEGHLAEVNLIDGLALTPASFGETKAGIWIPKNTSGLTFGTNGYRLKFQDSSSIGDDTSGNGNDLSPSGLAATDVILDSPTNNHSTFNPLEAESLLTYSENNLALAYSGSTNRALARSTIKMPASTDAFFEVKITSSLGSGVDMAIGIEDGTALSANDAAVYNNAYVIREDGNFIDQSSSGSYGVSFTNNDVIGVWRKANGDLVFYKNGTAMNSGTPAKTGLTGEFHFVAGPFNGASCIARFASDEWTNAPSGVDSTMSLCADNLPDPGIDPAQDEEPTDYFNTVLYTGDGNATQNVTVGFDPDFTWIKSRSSGSGHHSLIDSVRGDVALNSNQSVDEYGVGAFNSNANGTIDVPYYANDYSMNTSSATYVAWNWLAGGSASSNSNGTITSSVSANTEAGFSIVGYTGTGSAGTVGHGLSSAPEMIIQKMRNPSSAENWTVFHKDLTSDNYFLRLNLVNGEADGSGNYFSATSSTTFSIGSTSQVNENTKNSIAYCFHSVDGYCKVGSYVGNGSTDGPFVYTGFRPAWVLIKSKGGSPANNGWYLYDNKRENYGTLVDAQMYANLSSADDNGNRDLDFTSNGFKPRLTDVNVNGSGATFIYLAISDQPFKYANAR